MKAPDTDARLRNVECRIVAALGRQNEIIVADA
jgi:hypothetical protein